TPACRCPAVFVNGGMVVPSDARLADTNSAAAEPIPLVWVLHDGKPGMASQALGLAEAAGLPFIEKRLAVRLPWSWLPPQLWVAPLRAVSDRERKLAPPWPDRVIGCGRN